MNSPGDLAKQPLTANEVLLYVKAAARALDLPLDESAARSVAEHFARTAALARLLDAVELAPDHELAEIYRPAPFPATVDSEGSN
jgi:hypothetical protein